MAGLATVSGQGVGMSTVSVSIVGRRLPGRTWSGRSGIHVGVQRGAEVVGVMPGDLGEAHFDLDLEVVEVEVDGERAVDFKGPFVHGRRVERFIYLSWGEVDEAGEFTMFRRLKLQLRPLAEQFTPDVLLRAQRIRAFLELTDTKGRPVAASVRPPWVLWRVD